MDNENWIILADIEKKSYLDVHSARYKEDIKHAEAVALEFPRWSIISGYYAMHDCAKLFLAKQFNIKVTSPQIHAKTILALGQFIKEEETKQKVLILLKEAKECFYNAERLKERTIPILLKRGKAEREQAQYYTEDYSNTREINSKKAIAFIDEIVKPFINIIERML